MTNELAELQTLGPLVLAGRSQGLDMAGHMDGVGQGNPLFWGE